MSMMKLLAWVSTVPEHKYVKYIQVYEYITSVVDVVTACTKGLDNVVRDDELGCLTDD